MLSPPCKPAPVTDSERPYAEPRQASRAPCLGTPAASLVFGVITPIVCYFWDPGLVFQPDPATSTSPLRGVESFCLALVAVEMGLLVLWLTLGSRLRWVNALGAGVFYLGAGSAWLLGLSVMPYTLFAWTFGLFLAANEPGAYWWYPGYGLLGLSVLITGSIYFFHANEAATLARQRLSSRGLFWRAVLGGFLTVCLALAAQVATERNQDPAPPPAAPGD